MKIVWTVFEKFEYFIERSGEKKQKKQHDCISSRKIFPTPKKVENGPVLAIFGLNLVMFFTSQPYDFDAIAHIRLFYGVE